MEVKKHYNLLMKEKNDSFHDDGKLKAYMDTWNGKSFIAELKLSKRKSVLEIGIGTGRIAVKVILCLFKRKKNEQIMISRINEIISSSGYQLVL